MSVPICYGCGRPAVDDTEPPMPLCECDDSPSVRMVMELSGGRTMSAYVSRDVSQETLLALRALGEAHLVGQADAS